MTDSTTGVVAGREPLVLRHRLQGDEVHLTSATHDELQVGRSDTRGQPGLRHDRPESLSECIEHERDEWMDKAKES